MQNQLAFETEVKAKQAIKIYTRFSLPLYKHLLTAYNQAGVFNNLNDDMDGLTQALQENFEHVDINLIGNIDLFRASDAYSNLHQALAGSV